MTTQVGTKYDDVLADITVAPDRWAPAPPTDRWAAAAAQATVDRWAPTIDRWAATTVDRWAAAALAGATATEAGTDRYAAAAATAKAEAKADTGHKLVRRTVVIIPPHDPRGRLLWVPGDAFQECFEDRDWQWVWRRGDLVDFDEAAENAKFTRYEDDDYRLSAFTTDSEDDTFVEDSWGDYDEKVWTAMMGQALALRSELAADPDRVCSIMDLPCRQGLRILAGLEKTPTSREIFDAIVKDPAHGLGGAALDHAVWCDPEKFGPTGKTLIELAQIIQDDGYMRSNPVDNFLLYSGSLHPGTVGEIDPYVLGRESYALTGEYAVVKVDYTSDLTGKVIGGWRSIYLEPFNRGQ